MQLRKTIPTRHVHNVACLNTSNACKVCFFEQLCWCSTEFASVDLVITQHHVMVNVLVFEHGPELLTKTLHFPMAMWQIVTRCSLTTLSPHEAPLETSTPSRSELSCALVFQWLVPGFSNILFNLAIHEVVVDTGIVLRNILVCKLNAPILPMPMLSSVFTLE